MRNIQLTLAYDGTHYRGWQVQPGARSVQGTLEEAIHRLTGERLRVLASGRTDSGVHALGQVVNFRTESRIPVKQFRPGLQHFLPKDVVVRDATEVPLEFHATYSAKKKRYRYVIHNSPISDPFVSRYADRFDRELDAAAMQEAGQVLAGTHDFRSFETESPRKAGSVRTVTEVTVRRVGTWSVWDPADAPPPPGPLPPSGEGGGNRFLTIDVVADGFLYNMVRAIAGTLLKVGRGQWTADDVRRILESRDRSRAGPTAPARGLFLVCVDYGGGGSNHGDTERISIRNPGRQERNELEG